MKVPEKQTVTPSKRTVSGRLLVSFVVVFLAFGVTVTWCFQALRGAAHDAQRLRSTYVPLMSTVNEALAGQNVMNAQLNHVTSARNPDDVRAWIATARRLRPVSLERIRQQVRSGLRTEAKERLLRDDVLKRCDDIDRAVRGQGQKVDAMFRALAEARPTDAEQLRDELVAIEADVAKRLRIIRGRIDRSMQSTIRSMRSRERWSMHLLLTLSVLTLLVGLVTSVHARRVLQPLSHVTERARAVASGDLSEREVLRTRDELGELAETFEDMVGAIRQTRADLVQAERLATIGKMAAQITHEVRNPLSSIGLNLEMLEEEVGAGEESGQLLRAIRAEVDRLAEIAEKYLAVARNPNLALAPENVGDLVREFHTFVRPEIEEAGVHSEVEVIDEDCVAEVDDTQLRQALRNLVRNAVEATGEGGRVSMRVLREGSDIVIEIIDDGRGIGVEDVEQCFDLFYTTKSSGTGLGLAVTRAIVAAHGGRLEHVAPDAGGSCFRLRLNAHLSGSSSVPPSA